MDLEMPKKPASGWKRLWIIGTVLWAIQALGLAAVIAVGVFGKSAKPLDAKNMAAVLGMAAVYLVAPPLLAWWTGKGIGRMASGKRPLCFRDLSGPRKAWFILAAALYLFAFLPGVAGLLFYPTTLAASAVMEMPLAGSPATSALLFAIAALPQWLAYTLASYLIMRLADWVWKGFSRGNVEQA